jgi:hypothetical protein
MGKKLRSGSGCYESLETIFWVKNTSATLLFNFVIFDDDRFKNSSCAANFSFAQLAKRKSLGRSKPATNSQAQAPQHTVWNVSTISKPY